MAEPDADERAMPRRLGVREFRGNLTGFLRQARHESSFLVTSRGEVLAEVRPPSTSVSTRRQPGALRGKIRMADDFDALPPDLLAAIASETGRSASSTPTLSCGG